MGKIYSQTHKGRVFITHVILIATCLLVLFPLFMIISISLREGNFAQGAIIPKKISFEHWALALGIPYQHANGSISNPPFPVLTWLWNSVKVGALSSFLIVFLSTTCAYAFARLKFKGKGFLLDSMLLLQIFPAVLSLVAIFAIFTRLGDYVSFLGVNQHGSLILAYAGGLAMHIWTIRGYFQTIDPALEEAALMDGANHFQAFRKILLPLSVPILAVVFILAFIGCMMEYPVASILMQENDKLTLAVGMGRYFEPNNILWGHFAAAAVLSSLPVTILFLICQKYLTSNLTAGAVKG